MNHRNDTVDYRLLNSLSELVLCSRCFRKGDANPVPQLISDRHTIKNLCAQCTAETLPKRGENSPQRQRLIQRYLNSK